MLKRLIDLVLALIAVGLLWPVFVIIFVLIRRDSGEGAVFVQERAGKGGIPFQFYKFRTMRIDTDPYGPSPKGGNDPRLTSIGKFLRESSLDELPQLFNILKGDMSFVGPRPLYVSQIEEWDETQKQRLWVKPGLTGLAQTSGRGELTREEKLALDVVYVQTRSLWLDFRLMVRTFLQILGKKDIYEKQYSQSENTRGETKLQ